MLPMTHFHFAYVGPGAGFAFLGSLLSLVLSLLAGLTSLLLWPFRVVWGMVRRERGMRAAHVKRAILLGLHGFDTAFAARLMAEGKLPGFSRMQEQGTYTPLRTSVQDQWTTFATGVNEIS